MNGAALLAVLAVLIVAARTRLTATVLGQPVSMPVLWLVAAAVVLAIAALTLYLLRSVLRDGGLLLRPRTVGT